ncbi:hypothetical protein SLA2020_380730 [Shorea laevis]
MAAENWIVQMEKLLDMCCTDDHIVRYATFKLTADAECLCVAKKEHLDQRLGKGMSISWKNFKEAFLECFFPPLVRQAKAQEFTELIQGSLTVEQYAAKFIELSWFAPYLLATLKARKFERALLIVNQIGGFEIGN